MAPSFAERSELLAADSLQVDVQNGTSGKAFSFSKNFNLQPRFGGKTDWIEIDGMEPIEAISADWSSALKKKMGAGVDMLCDAAPVHFDAANSNGSMIWGSGAQGAIVVAIRGLIDFDEMAHNAAKAGAVALIVIDNQQKFRNSHRMTCSKLSAPPIPAVIVSQQHFDFMCASCNGANAKIMRRKSKLSGSQIAGNVLKASTPGSVAPRNFKLQPRFGGKTDWIEIDGMAPIEGISADWSSALKKPMGSGVDILCDAAPVHFDANNSSGSMAWGPGAQGAIVVAVRGMVDCDELAHKAAQAGAVGLIIIDNAPKFRNNFEMTCNKLSAPTIPAVIVGKEHSQFMSAGCNGAHAKIMRRKSKLSGSQIAGNMLKALSPF